MAIALDDRPDQKMILVDSRGKTTGEVLDRKSSHSTPGKKHLAIQVLLFNNAKELILHERPLKKVGGGVWDAPTTHVIHGETPEEAARRCLLDEYGISEKIPLTVLDGFSYEKDYGDGSCENEFCLASFAVYDKVINANPEHVPAIVRVRAKKVLEELETGSSRYPIWFFETVKIVKSDSEGKRFFV